MNVNRLIFFSFFLLHSCNNRNGFCEDCSTLFEAVRKEGDVNAYGKLVLFERKQATFFNNSTMKMVYVYKNEYANYIMFSDMCMSVSNEYYFIDSLPYIDKCFALDKLNNAYLKKEPNSEYVVSYYLKNKKDYFIQEKTGYVYLNPKYIPVMNNVSE